MHWQINARMQYCCDGFTITKFANDWWVLEPPDKSCTIGFYSLKEAKNIAKFALQEGLV